MRSNMTRSLALLSLVFLLSSSSQASTVEALTIENPGFDYSLNGWLQYVWPLPGSVTFSWDENDAQEGSESGSALLARSGTENDFAALYGSCNEVPGGAEAVVLGAQAFIPGGQGAQSCTEYFLEFFTDTSCSTQWIGTGQTMTGYCTDLVGLGATDEWLDLMDYASYSDRDPFLLPDAVQSLRVRFGNSQFPDAVGDREIHYDNAGAFWIEDTARWRLLATLGATAATAEDLIAEFSDTETSLEGIPTFFLYLLPAFGQAVMTVGPVDIAISDPRGRFIEKDVGSLPAALYFETDFITLEDEVDLVLMTGDSVTGSWSITTTPEGGENVDQAFSLIAIERKSDGFLNVVKLIDGQAIGTLSSFEYEVSFAASPVVVYVDGFESGDLSGWSSAQP